MTQDYFKVVELDVYNTLRKKLNHTFLNHLKHLPYIARQCEKLVAWMITVHHLCIGSRSAADIEKEEGMAGRFEQSPRTGT